MSQTNKSVGSLWVRRFAYGSGDAACNIVAGMLSTILVLFYTDYVGLNAGIVGTIMLVSRVIDGICAVLMGFVAAGTRSKHGKYRPWILWNVLPYAISIVLLFTVPMTTKAIQYIYLFVAYNLCTSIFYNTINIPYGSLAYVLTREPKERDMLSVIRTCCACAGKLLAVCGTMPLVKLWGDGRESWIMATLIWAVAAIGLLYFCFFFCKEEVVVPVAERKTSVWLDVKNVMQNKYFWASSGLQILQMSYFVVAGTSLTYYCKYILKNDDWLYSSLYLLETVVIICVMLCCPIVIRKYGKRKVAAAGCVLAAAGQLLLWTAPASLPMVCLNCILRSVGFGPLNCVVFSFIGETVEYGYWKTNRRQESLIYAISLAFGKVGVGLTTACITGLLSLAGYISTTADVVQVQPEGVLTMIQNIYIFGPLFVFVLACVVMSVNKLDKKMPQILQDIKEREKICS